MTNWISMKDKKPEEGQEVWYYFDVVGVHCGRYHLSEDGDLFIGLNGFLTDDVTHWMPLEKPLPPKVGGKELMKHLGVEFADEKPDLNLTEG